MLGDSRAVTEEVAGPSCASLRRSPWSALEMPLVNYLPHALLSQGCCVPALCGLTLRQHGLSRCLHSPGASALMTRRGICSQSSVLIIQPDQRTDPQPRACCRRPWVAPTRGCRELGCQTHFINQIRGLLTLGAGKDLNTHQVWCPAWAGSLLTCGYLPRSEALCATASPSPPRVTDGPSCLPPAAACPRGAGLWPGRLWCKAFRI